MRSYRSVLYLTIQCVAEEIKLSKAMVCLGFAGHLKAQVIHFMTTTPKNS